MPKGTMKTMAGTKNHDLSDLTGKKIKSITLQEVDLSGTGEDVRQFYHFLCSDGEKLVLACENSGATLMDPDDFADFLEQLECEDELADEEEEEETEESFDEDNLFDDTDDYNDE
jgi:hypothetical protein